MLKNKEENHFFPISVMGHVGVELLLTKLDACPTAQKCPIDGLRYTMPSEG